MFQHMNSVKLHQIVLGVKISPSGFEWQNAIKVL